MKKTNTALFAGILFFAMNGCKKEKTTTAETPQTKIAFKLKLKNTNGNITYIQSITNINQLEYKWAIFVDSDSDSTTGDIFGYDVEISMTYFKQSNTSYNSGLLSKTQYNTWILEKNSGKYGHSLFAGIDATNNTLILTGIKESAELSRIN